jgi:hypothetical protein
MVQKSERILSTFAGPERQDSVPRKTARPLTPKADYTLHAGRSLVGETPCLQLHCTSYEGKYVIVDIELNSELPSERLAWFDPPSNPGSTILMHKQPDDIWRIDYQLRDDENPEEAVTEKPDPTGKRPSRDDGREEGLVAVWIAIYRAHALSLESYRITVASSSPATPRSCSPSMAPSRAAFTWSARTEMSWLAGAW